MMEDTPGVTITEFTNDTQDDEMMEDAPDLTITEITDN